MPYKGHKSLTITYKSDKLLGKIRRSLGEKSKSSAANHLIRYVYEHIGEFKERQRAFKEFE